MMTAAFRHCKTNAVYKAIDCKENELKKWIGKIRLGEIAGANVTMPYKEVVMKYLDRLTPAAKKIGAVNTIYRRGNKVVGDNTDGIGFSRALPVCAKPPRCKNTIVIGSGGAAKAIWQALFDMNISSLTIVSRSSKRVKLSTSIIPKILTHSSTLLINTTPLGTHGRPWPSLDFIKRLPKSTIVFDIITHPTETPLIKAARKHGLKVIDGREMLFHQGALAFEQWTGKKAPVGVMREAIT